jgi:hypothetical protein
MRKERPAFKVPEEETKGRSARATSRPGRFSPGEICPRIHWRLGGSQSHSRPFGEDKYLASVRNRITISRMPPRSLFNIRPAISRLEEWQRYRATDSVGGFRRSLFWFRRAGNGRFRRPRCLRRGFGAARLLGLRVRISQGAWMSVSCECCVCCQVEVSATDGFLVQSSPTEWRVCLCCCGLVQQKLTPTMSK